MAALIHSVLPNPPRPIMFVEPHVNVENCIDLMIEKDIGALVVRDGPYVLGIVSERDILRQCLYKRLDPKQTTAANIAYVNFKILDINEPVEKAMEVITQTKRRHVLVSDENGLVAVLSIGDLLFYLLDDKSRMIQHLENYIHS